MQIKDVSDIVAKQEELLARQKELMSTYLSVNAYSKETISGGGNTSIAGFSLWLDAKRIALEKEIAALKNEYGL